MFRRYLNESKKDDIIDEIVEVLNTVPIKKLERIRDDILNDVSDSKGKGKYTGRVEVVSTDGSAFNIGKIFKDPDELAAALIKAKVKDTTATSNLLCSLVGWRYLFKYQLSLPNRDVFTFKDAFDNPMKLWVYKK